MTATMEIPAEVTQYVDMMLHDGTKSARAKAQEAVEFIESYARAEIGVEPDVPLIVPPEWAHRIPGETELERREKVYARLLADLDAIGEDFAWIGDVAAKTAAEVDPLVVTIPRRRWWQR